MAEDLRWSGDLGVEFPFTNIFFTDLTLPGNRPVGSNDGEGTVDDLPLEARFQAMFYCVHYDDGVTLELRYRKVCFSDELAQSVLWRTKDALHRIGERGAAD